MDMQEEATPVTIRIMNDPRVTSFLRFMGVLLGGLTLWSVSNLASTASNWSVTMQRLTYVVEDLSKRTVENEKDVESLERTLRDIQVQVEVDKQQQSAMAWQLNSLLRQAGR